MQSPSGKSPERSEVRRFVRFLPLFLTLGALSIFSRVWAALPSGSQSNWAIEVPGVTSPGNNDWSSSDVSRLYPNIIESSRDPGNPAFAVEVASPNSTGDAARVFETTDSGKTWHEAPLPANLDIADEQVLQAGIAPANGSSLPAIYAEYANLAGTETTAQVAQVRADGSISHSAWASVGVDPSQLTGSWVVNDQGRERLEYVEKGGDPNQVVIAVTETAP